MKGYISYKLLGKLEAKMGSEWNRGIVLYGD